MKKQNGFENQIKNIRIESGHTVRSFAKLIGSNRETVHRWEKGKRGLSEKFAFILSKQSGIQPRILQKNQKQFIEQMKVKK